MCEHLFRPRRFSIRLGYYHANEQLIMLVYSHFEGRHGVASYHTGGGVSLLVIDVP